MKNTIISLTSVAAVLFTTITSAFAAPAAKAEGSRALAIQLGAPFHDHAVLQRGMNVPIWGWSQPGTKVTVEFAGQKSTVTAGADGKWVAELKDLKASFEPATLVIREHGGKTETLNDILVGEVWLASGQSNMQWTTGKSKVAQLADAFKSSNVGKVAPIREFQVSSVTSQLHPIKKASGSWKRGNYNDYSAIAFAFAHDIFQEVNVPIGILNCSFSQTSIQAWIPREGYASAEDDYSQAIHLKCLQTDPTTPEHKKAWGDFYRSLNDQIAASEKAIKEGSSAKKITEPLPGNLQSNRDANWLFNGRLSPVVPYAIRGAIWNQGYANMGEGLPYYNNLHSLIRGWRIVWDKPDLPVYFHQFYSAGMKHPGKEINKPSISPAAEMRLGTWLARDIPNTGMASQIDISGAIHYRAKAVPGQRLALHALKHQYGRKDLITDGPMFKSYKVKGNSVIIEFDHAEGGLVVAGTGYNVVERHEDSTGYANPKVIPNGDDQVKLFFVAGNDRIWHPATVKIAGDKVIVSSLAVNKPLGVSYGTGEIGYQPNLYNKALLPMTPFIYYDNKKVTSDIWPDEKLKIAGEVIDPKTVGKIYAYRKMPLLSVQFRDNAVFQADKPVTIWGSTRQYGEWQDKPEAGDCKVHFEFGDIQKVIDVTPEMAEWKVTLPPMKASAQPHTLKVHFTIDGETVHRREVKGIVFGDVWCVVAPVGDFKVPEVKPSGQIVRMIENQSNRDGRALPSRFSICTSRTPRVLQQDGKWSNRVAAYWKDAEGLAAAFGNHISAKTGRPAGIIFLKARKDIPVKNWIAPSFLKYAPSLMEDYKTVGSQYPDNPYYLANMRRYVAAWKAYWENEIPEMMSKKAVPNGNAWGSYPSPKPEVGDSTATFEYNVYMHCFTPTAMSGIVFLTGEAMVAGNEGASFGPEIAALAKSLKTRFSLWQNDEDIPLIYTIPSQALAPKLTQPKEIEGKSIAVELKQWLELEGVFNVLAK
ncbi:MAG: hypothetical protein KJO21_10285 [Verrucomicrobiae bacterium]|nr:hypothetical protein [Verrucomicrobiae bacterium]NNJ42322.1 hypothetical protein [Akkermansiaceae bacterium]